MADMRQPLDKVILIDVWPGVAKQGTSVPTDGFQGNTHHNVLATGVYKPGTKISVETSAGISTLIYLKMGTPSATAVAAGTMLGLEGTTCYTVTNNKSTVVIGGPACVALSAMTATYWGWFWCGGVYPNSTDVKGGLTAATATRLETDNSVVVATSACGLAATAGNNCGLAVHAAKYTPIAIALANNEAI